MAGYTYWDAVVGRLQEIEHRYWPLPHRGGPLGSDSGNRLPAPGPLSAMNQMSGSMMIGDIMHAMPGYRSAMQTYHRVRNVTRAINESFPYAFTEIERQLGGISIASIEDVLKSMLRDVAICLGGSTALGAGVGGVAGSFFFGVGAAPGMAIGATAGFEIGEFILTFTGLKSIVNFMKDAVPTAINYYGMGFRKAWGGKNDDAPFASFAYKEFAKGHVLFFMAILMGIVGYLMRGKGNLPTLLGEIRASSKLGPQMADWVTTNSDALIRNPALQQGIRASTGAGATETETPVIASQGPIRGQTSPHTINPDAPISPPSQTPATLPRRSAPPFLERVRAGNEFDDVRAPAYPYNELHIDQPDGTYTKLDSYNPFNGGEIVSRKFTQLADVQEQTAINYINEIPSKYSIGSTIRDVPTSGDLAGQQLMGEYILEVPPQISPVPQSVLNAATRSGITIRDTAGFIYNE